MKMKAMMYSSSSTSVSSPSLREFVWRRLSRWDEWVSNGGPQQLCSDYEIPEDAREAFIVSGYRAIGTSPRKCLHSFFQFHNETLNIWTHVVATVCFLYILYNDVYEASVSTEQLLQTFPCFAFAFCLILCFTGSTVAHGFNCMSVKARKILFVTDYAGVGMNALAAGLCYTEFIPLEWHMLQSKDQLAALKVLGMVLAVTGCSIAQVHWGSWWPGQILKAASFGSLCIVGNISMIRYQIYISAENPEEFSRLSPHFYWMLLAMFWGGFFLSSCIPERLSKETFDICGHSHQWFHICAFVSTKEQYRLLHAMSQNHVIESPTNTCLRVVITLMAAVVCNVLLILWFAKEAVRIGQKKTKEA